MLTENEELVLQIRQYAELLKNSSENPAKIQKGLLKIADQLELNNQTFRWLLAEIVEKIHAQEVNLNQIAPPSIDKTKKENLKSKTKKVKGKAKK